LNRSVLPFALAHSRLRVCSLRYSRFSCRVYDPGYPPPNVIVFAHILVTFPLRYVSFTVGSRYVSLVYVVTVVATQRCLRLRCWLLRFPSVSRLPCCVCFAFVSALGAGCCPAFPVAFCCRSVYYTRSVCLRCGWHFPFGRCCVWILRSYVLTIGFRLRLRCYPFDVILHFIKFSYTFLTRFTLIIPFALLRSFSVVSHCTPLHLYGSLYGCVCVSPVALVGCVHPWLPFAFLDSLPVAFVTLGLRYPSCLRTLWLRPLPHVVTFYIRLRFYVTLDVVCFGSRAVCVRSVVVRCLPLFAFRVFSCSIPVAFALLILFPARLFSVYSVYVLPSPLTF